MPSFEKITLKTETLQMLNPITGCNIESTYRTITYTADGVPCQLPLDREVIRGFMLEEQVESIKRTGWDDHYSSFSSEERQKDFDELTEEDLMTIVELNHDEDCIIEEVAREMWEELLTIKEAA